MDMYSRGSTAWRGMTAKDHDLLKVHAVDDGHVILLNR
jgi:hypothetical protein